MPRTTTRGSTQDLFRNLLRVLSRERENRWELELALKRVRV